MSSETPGGRQAPAASSPSVPAQHPPPAGAPSQTDGRGSRRRARRIQVILAVALLLALVAAGYLLVLSRAWAERAGELASTAHELGGELGRTRADLEESRGTLALVEGQLDGAQDQIHELANTVAQSGDDREIQRQVNDYQAQVSAAARSVAQAMDQCIVTQREFIDVLEEAATLLHEQATRDSSAGPSASPSGSPSADEAPSPEQRVMLNMEALDDYRSQVSELCGAAESANDNLQQQLDNS